MRCALSTPRPRMAPASIEAARGAPEDGAAPSSLFSGTTLVYGGAIGRPYRVRDGTMAVFKGENAVQTASGTWNGH